MLLVPSGMTVDQLRQLLWPDVPDVCLPDGTSVTSGRLCTGMTVGDLAVVVPGDCNGTGSVSIGDLRQAQVLLLESSQVEDPYRWAADLNEDGVLTTEDLVLLSQMLPD